MRQGWDRLRGRDLTKAQFDAACQRHSIRPAVFGYYEIGNGVSIYARNAGDRRRDQLAYLLRKQCEEQGRQGKQDASN